MRSHEIRSLLLMVSLTLAAWCAGGQTLNDLARLGRDSLIKIAVSKIDDRSFDVSLFDRVSVRKTGGDIVVHFDQMVRFVPRTGVYLYDVSVRIRGNTLGGTALSNPGWQAKKGRATDPWSVKYFNPSPGHVSKQIFVMDHLKKLPGMRWWLESIGDTGHVTIYDNARYFSLSIDAGNSMYSCRMEKRTGKISDENRVQLELSPHHNAGTLIE